MKFECGDLERALAVSDLMPEAREHLKTCAACRAEYRLWNEISATGRGLHEDWETAALWPNIRKAIEAERRPGVAWWQGWKVWAIAATLALAIALPVWWRHETASSPPSEGRLQTQDFLTEQALVEVEKNEAVYRKSIEKLSRLAEPKLERAASPAAVNAREKLLLLDSAINETKGNAAVNRFNIRLQTTLADLYREKQQTLEELLTRGQKN